MNTQITSNTTRLLKHGLLAVSVVALLTGIGLSGSVYAHKHGGPDNRAQKHAMHPGHHNMMHRALMQLELSNDQMAQIRALKEQHWQDNPRPENREERHARMQALVTAETFDQGSAEQLAAEIVEQMQSRMVARMKLHHDIYQLLQPEQQQELKQLLQNLPERRGIQGQGRRN